jgi:hypothetical protein
MIFTGKIQLADNSFIQFFENGDVLKTVRKQHTKITMQEAIMYIQNTPSYVHASKTYMLDGKAVTYSAFKTELDKLEPAAPTIDDKEYSENYIEHTPLHIRNGVEAVVSEEVEVSKVETEKDEDEDDEPAIIVDPEDTGDWFA